MLDERSPSDGACALFGDSRRLKSAVPGFCRPQRSQIWNGWRPGRFGFSAPSKNRAVPMSAATQLGRVATQTLLTFLSHALNGCVSIQNTRTAQVVVIGAIRAVRKGTSV